MHRAIIKLTSALLLAGFASSATAQLTNLPGGIDALRGRVWNGSECCGWTWDLVQQSGPIFRGSFRNPNGQRLLEPSIVISITGSNRVTITRGNGSAGGGCTYEGTIRAGSASGTYACAGRPAGNWSATISHATSTR